MVIASTEMREVCNICFSCYFDSALKKKVVTAIKEDAFFRKKIKTVLDLAKFSSHLSR